MNVHSVQNDGMNDKNLAAVQHALDKIGKPKRHTKTLDTLLNLESPGMGPFTNRLFEGMKSLPELPLALRLLIRSQSEEWNDHMKTYAAKAKRDFVVKYVIQMYCDRDAEESFFDPVAAIAEVCGISKKSANGPDYEDFRIRLKNEWLNWLKPEDDKLGVSMYLPALQSPLFMDNAVFKAFVEYILQWKVLHVADVFGPYFHIYASALAGQVGNVFVAGAICLDLNHKEMFTQQVIQDVVNVVETFKKVCQGEHVEPTTLFVSVAVLVMFFFQVSRYL